MSGVTTATATRPPPDTRRPPATPIAEGHTTRRGPDHAERSTDVRRPDVPESMDAEYLADQLADDLDYVDDTALEWIDLEIERLRRAVARAYADGVRRALYGEVDRRSARTAVAAAAELKYWRAVRAEVARRRPW